MKLTNATKLIIAVVISELAGIFGSAFTAPSIAGWYAALTKPAINPPAWVFGPVWTTLYALMGVAAFLIWKKGLGRADVKRALGIFAGQLVLNAAWSIYFVGQFCGVSKLRILGIELKSHFVHARFKLFHHIFTFHTHLTAVRV